MLITIAGIGVLLRSVRKRAIFLLYELNSLLRTILYAGKTELAVTGRLHSSRRQLIIAARTNVGADINSRQHWHETVTEEERQQHQGFMQRSGLDPEVGFLMKSEKFFTVTDACIDCGICTYVCPRGKFSGMCLSILSCSFMSKLGSIGTNR